MNSDGYYYQPASSGTTEVKREYGMSSAPTQASPVDAGEFQTSIDWFVQQGLDSTIYRYCTDTLRKLGCPANANFLQYGEQVCLESIVILWRAYALVNLGQRVDAIRLLALLTNIADMKLVVTASLITATKAKSPQEAQTIQTVCSSLGINQQTLKEDLKVHTKAANYCSFVLAARYFWYVDKLKQAKHCIDRALERAQNNVAALTLAGWIYLASGSPRFERRALQLFDAALTAADQYKALCIQHNALVDDGNGNGPNDPFLAVSTANNFHALGALMGRATALSTLACLTQHTHAQLPAGSMADAHAALTTRAATIVDDLNVALVAFPSFGAGYIEKTRLYIGLRMWPEAMSVLNRWLSLDAGDPAALELVLLHALLHDTNTPRAVLLGKAVLAALEQREPGNHVLLLRLARTLLHWSGLRAPLLLLGVEAANRAWALLGADAETRGRNGAGSDGDGANDATTASSAVACVLGRLHARLGYYTLAERTFAAAAERDRDNLDALLGRVWARVVRGAFAEAAEELEFVRELLLGAGALDHEEERGPVHGGVRGVTHASLGHHLSLLLLSAVLAWRWRRDERTAILLLHRACGVFTSFLGSLTTLPAPRVPDAAAEALEAVRADAHGGTGWGAGNVAVWAHVDAGWALEAVGLLLALAGSAVCVRDAALGTGAGSFLSLLGELDTAVDEDDADADAGSAGLASDSAGASLAVLRTCERLCATLPVCPALHAYRAWALANMGSAAAVEEAHLAMDLSRKAVRVGAAPVAGVATDEENGPLAFPSALGVSVSQLHPQHSLNYPLHVRIGLAGAADARLTVPMLNLAAGNDKLHRFLEATAHLSLARAHLSRAIAACDSDITALRAPRAGATASVASGRGASVATHLREAAEALETAKGCDFGVKLFLPYVTARAILMLAYAQQNGSHAPTSTPTNTPPALREYSTATWATFAAACADAARIPGVCKWEGLLPYFLVVPGADACVNGTVVEGGAASPLLDGKVSLVTPLSAYNCSSYVDRLLFVSLYAHALMQAGRAQELPALTQHIYQECKRASVPFPSSGGPVDTQEGYHGPIEQCSLLASVYVAGLAGSNQSDVGVVYDTQHLKLCEALLLLLGGDHEGAMRRLTLLPLHRPHLALGRALSTAVHMRHARDKRAFLASYQVTDPSSYTQWLELADAHVRVSEVAKALTAYRSALEQVEAALARALAAGKDARVATLRRVHTLVCGRIGQALVSMHDYGGAVQYYTAILAKPSAGNAPGGWTDVWEREYEPLLRLELAGIYVYADAPVLALATLAPAMVVYAYAVRDPCVALLVAWHRAGGDLGPACAPARGEAAASDPLLLDNLAHAHTRHVSAALVYTLAAHLCWVLQSRARGPDATQWLSAAHTCLQGARLAAQAAALRVTAPALRLRYQALVADVHVAVAQLHLGAAIPVSPQSVLAPLTPLITFSTPAHHAPAPTAAALSAAHACYEDARRACPTHTHAKLCLARSLLAQGHLDDCAQECVEILSTQPEALAASGNAPLLPATAGDGSVPEREVRVLLAETRMAQGELEKALQLFRQALAQDPRDMHTLARMLEVVWLSGRVQDYGPKLVAVSENAYGSRAMWPAGLWYCKGVLAAAMWDDEEALYCLAQCRRAEAGGKKSTVIAGEWGELAVLRMARIYLRADVWQMQQAVAIAVGAGHNVPHSQLSAVGQDEARLQQAEALLKELHAYQVTRAAREGGAPDAGVGGEGSVCLSVGEVDARVAEAYLDLCGHRSGKAKVEKALSTLTQVLRHDREHVGANVAVGVALGLLGQHAKARNQLRRVGKGKGPSATVTGLGMGAGTGPTMGVGWSAIRAEEGEAAAILGALLLRNKEEEARAALRDCLQTYRGCVRALVVLAELDMNSGNVASSCRYYERAWAQCNEGDPQIGYAFAASCLRAKRYVDAARVANKVAYAYPDFAKVRKEVGEKAKMLIRAHQ